MKLRNVLTTAVLAAGLLLPAQTAFGIDLPAEADIRYKAITSGDPIPISTVPESEQTEANAYIIQEILHKKIMQATGDAIVGFKASLTAEPQIQRFKAPGPASAPLFKSGLIRIKEPKKAVKIQSVPGIMLQMELAFLTAMDIKSPVGTIDELKGKVKSVHACIEAPRIWFSDMDNLSFFDLTAAGLGTSMFLVGPPRGFDDLDLDSMEVTLTRDNETVNTGRGSDVMGSQWKALLWLVNNAVARNGGVGANCYLLTGAMGSMIPGENGAYTATFPFETLKFVITEK